MAMLQGEVRAPIGPVDYPGLSSGLFAASDAGKPALSRYRVLTRHADSTLVEVRVWLHRARLFLPAFPCRARLCLCSRAVAHRWLLPVGM